MRGQEKGDLLIQMTA